MFNYFLCYFINYLILKEETDVFVILVLLAYVVVKN